MIPTDALTLLAYLAFGVVLSLALLALTVYGWLATLEAVGVIETGSTDLVVYRLIETGSEPYGTHGCDEQHPLARQLAQEAE